MPHGVLTLTETDLVKTGEAASSGDKIRVGTKIIKQLISRTLLERVVTPQ